MKRRPAPRKQPKADVITARGKVTEALPNTQFLVSCPEFDQPVLATLAGKMRVHYIRVMVGDQVEVEISTHDTGTDFLRGRITFRYR